jgi:hypothetical protein
MPQCYKKRMAAKRVLLKPSALRTLQIITLHNEHFSFLLLPSVSLRFTYFQRLWLLNLKRNVTLLIGPENCVQNKTEVKKR